ncbi:MAG: glycoside hydrolase family 3 N-terminal domain-containing protein, partial [Tsuneonella sp.]
HLVFPEWDAEHPATQSPTVIRDIIRGRTGFDGLLLTDDLDMEALAGSVPERAERAVAAGCDLALNCWAKMDDMIGIAARLPAMAPETAERLDRALAGTGGAAAADKAELLAKRDSLLALAGQAA